MNYVMSDLHGMFQEYREMLDKIHFLNDDSLYILGDICDRGPDTAKLYLDIISRNNVYCIRGNHEEMLLDALPENFGYLRELKGKLVESVYDSEIWCACGGNETRLSLFGQDREVVEEIYSYIKQLPFYRNIKIGETEYTLVHAGIENFSLDKPMDSYAIEEFIWYSPEFDDTLWNDNNKILIVGHTPTFIFREDKQAKIYHGKGNIIDIDCGAVFREDGGKLGCLCLETMEEFYV